MKNVRKEEVEMLNTQTTTPPLPLPQHVEKRLAQGEMRKDLFDSCAVEMKKHKIKIREVIEYGFAAWLIRVNPKEAMRLGLIDKK